MRTIAILAFLGGLLLAVRVMFFGVQRRLGEDRLAHRRWPLALAAFLAASGATLYFAAASGVTARTVTLVVLVGAVAALGAWWLVQRSAAAPSSDPEDDPRYRFQGHVARVVEPIGSAPDHAIGRVVFEFDGKKHELRARWTEESTFGSGSGTSGSEVVIERVEGDVAYVEPWTVVEQRL
jgi:membrane protein implicated in regulation of membrane protease activity